MKLRLVLPIVVIGAALAWVITRGLPQDLVYYRTPTEIVQTGPSSRPVRVGGLVEPGSLRRGDGPVRFVLTDGSTRLPVVQSGGVPQLFREGRGAVLEGTFGPDGVFRSDTAMVKHAETYRPPHASAGADG
ncbi:MAG TPA: cytochrome c maturation protein CcmE [Actinomycetota bacterium]|nr:cytochrome c maturation protein CcmE [Actinomycetota bacterium]